MWRIADSGLEAPIVFLCGMEHLSEELDRELIYVGLSRAKSRITLVGTQRAISNLVGAAAPGVTTFRSNAA